MSAEENDSFIDVPLELYNTLDLINEQIATIEFEAQQMRCSPMDLRTANGEFMMVNILLAKASVLTALTQLPTMNRLLYPTAAAEDRTILADTTLPKSKKGYW